MERGAIIGGMAGVAAVAGVVTLGAIRGDTTAGTVPFPYCVIRVFEDGSAVFRDAEAVREDAPCWRAVDRYVHRGGRK